MSGVYGVWLWLKEGKGFEFALLGVVLLTTYGFVNTLQPAHFGRVYAAYGGVFVIMSILWGWQVDKIPPDRYDVIGAIVVLTGVFIIMHLRNII
ncbi:YnfA family protein [Archaeoglobales archaeon]|nr:MAG: YnfA family protein [Archaeoglobales archaeon]